MTSFFAVTNSLLGLLTMLVSHFMVTEGHPVVMLAGVVLLLHGIRYAFVVNQEYQAEIEERIHSN